MRATTELVGPARRFPSTRSAACRVLSDGGLLPGCFQLATTSWLTSPLVSTAATSFGLHEAGRRIKTDGIGEVSLHLLGLYLVYRRQPCHLVDKSAGLVQRKRFSAAHARSREAHQDRWYRQLQLRGSVTRFLLVEEAQHRLPYARFLYSVGRQASCNWYIVGNRVSFFLEAQR